VQLADYWWLPDSRVLYSQAESQYSDDYNLWQIGIDGRTGSPIGKPKRITQWAGSRIENLYASVDGKRLLLIKTTEQGQVYIGDLSAGGTRMDPPRRLRSEETSDLPYGWTADSKAVLFASISGDTTTIFMQRIGQDTAEPLVTPPTAGVYPRISADGAWILYVEFPTKASTIRLMRVPVKGGVPQLVMELPRGLNHECSHAPANRCVVLEESQDTKHLMITAFDPLKGRGNVLRTIEKEASAGKFGSSLSPDGSNFAISNAYEADIHIRVLSLSGGPDRDITVKGWPTLSFLGLEWSADGKGFYCGSVSYHGRTVLYVDLKGNARVLWQSSGMGGYVWGIPSPDGRYLAIQGEASNSNVWMVEGF
jgi:Tol biopolymer transport system component